MFRFVCGVLVVLSGAIAQSAQAETIGFASIPSFDVGGTYEEAGFVVDAIDGTDTLGGDGAEKLHVEIFGGPFSSDYHVTRVGGGLFNAVSVFVEPLGIVDLIQGTSFLPNMAFTGLRNGVVVGQVRATSQDNQDKTVSFGGVLDNIDTMQISGFLAGNEDLFFTGNDIHFELDNLVVEPLSASVGPTTVIPLPASGLLLLGALGIFGGLTTRKRAASAA